MMATLILAVGHQNCVKKKLDSKRYFTYFYEIFLLVAQKYIINSYPELKYKVYKNALCAEVNFMLRKKKIIKLYCILPTDTSSLSSTCNNLAYIKVLGTKQHAAHIRLHNK